MPSSYILLELVKLIFVFWFSPFSRMYKRKSSSIFLNKAGSLLLFSVTLVDVCILSFKSFTSSLLDSVCKKQCQKFALLYSQDS